MSETTHSSRHQILTSLQIRQKIRRMAFEIYEQNFEESTIVIAGIVGEGYAFAKRLTREIEEISPLSIQLIELRFDIHAPRQSYIEYGEENIDLENQVVVVTDVVLNTGRTLAFSLQPFLKVALKKLQVAVVVDRSHRRFPVSADYVGYSLSTTFSDHVEVILSREEEEGAYLK